MDPIVTITVAIISGVFSLISIYFTHKLNKTKTIPPHTYEGDDIREHVLELAFEILGTFGFHWFKMIIFQIPIVIFLAIVLVGFFSSPISYVVFMSVINFVYLAIITNISINSFARSLKNLGMSKKEQLKLQHGLQMMGHPSWFLYKIILHKTV